MVIVVMGVAGAGKTTVGQRLAAAIGCRFADADDFHTPASIEKMRRGVTLDDADRAPWLAALGNAIDEWLRADACVVLACSALKAKYRALLRRDPSRVQFVYLKVPPALAHARVSSRSGHFMKDNLVAQQFEALEEPAHAIVVDASPPPDEIVSQIVRALPPDG